MGLYCRCFEKLLALLDASFQHDAETEVACRFLQLLRVPKTPQWTLLQYIMEIDDTALGEARFQAGTSSQRLTCPASRCR